MPRGYVEFPRALNINRFFSGGTPALINLVLLQPTIFIVIFINPVELYDTRLDKV